jgi:hypothetical protein
LANKKGERVKSFELQGHKMAAPFNEGGYEEWQLWDDETYGDENDIRFLLQPVLNDQGALKAIFRGLAEALCNISASDFDVFKGIEELLLLRKNSKFAFLEIATVVGDAQVKYAKALQEQQVRDEQSLSIVTGMSLPVPGKSVAFRPRQATGATRVDAASLMQLPKSCVLHVSSFLGNSWKVEREWVAGTGKWNDETAYTAESENPHAFSFSEDGKALFDFIENGSETMYDATNGTTKEVSQVRKLPPPREFGNHQYFWGRGLTTSLVACPEYESGILKVWDAMNGKFMQTLEGKTLEVSCCSFSPCGSLAIVGSTGNYEPDPWPHHGQEMPLINKNLKLYDVNTGFLKESWNFDDYFNILGVRCCDFAPCGKTFIFGLALCDKPDNTNTLEMYDVESFMITTATVQCPLASKKASVHAASLPTAKSSWPAQTQD